MSKLKPPRDVRVISKLVPGTGIEPVRFIQPQDFKSCASTCSATWAYICLVTRRRFELRTP